MGFLLLNYKIQNLSLKLKEKSYKKYNIINVRNPLRSKSLKVNQYIIVIDTNVAIFLLSQSPQLGETEIYL